MSHPASLDCRGLDGVRLDLWRRGKHYFSDWRDGMHPKAIAASLFMFFACIAPAVAFGGMLAVATEGQIGAIEMILATSACGIVYAVISGQPLTILGGTGPLLVFTGILYDLCRRFDLPFLTAYAWIGLWTGAFLVCFGLTGISYTIRYFTRFTDEIFAALISLIFVFQALKGILKAFPASHIADDSALLGLILALFTYQLSRSLARLRHGPYLRPILREILADFGPAVAILAASASRRLLPEVKLASLSLPSTLSPSLDRAWIVELGTGPAWLPWMSAIPAVLVALLVFLDQNITTRIIQTPDNNLKKGEAYHWDLVVVGLLLGACSLFGLPWLVAATVRSINHVRALVVKDGVLENRVSPLLIHLMVGISLLFTPWLSQVPMPVLYGLFLYMGVASMRGNQLFERMQLWLFDPQLLPDHHYLRVVPPRVVHAFTALQAGCLAILYWVKSGPLGILFPLLIALLVPLRWLVGIWISPEHLKALDSDESPQDAEDEMAGP